MEIHAASAKAAVRSNGTQIQTTDVDETTFRELYEWVATPLRSYLRVLCRDDALADDLMQEAFLRFLRSGVSGLNEFQMKAYRGL